MSPRLSCKRLRFKVVLVVEHGFQPLTGDVALALAVNGVADGHVVSRDAFGNRAGRAAHVEEPPHHFLACADLGKRAVTALVEVDGQCFAIGTQKLVRHGGNFSTGIKKGKTAEEFSPIHRRKFMRASTVASRRVGRVKRVPPSWVFVMVGLVSLGPPLWLLAHEASWNHEIPFRPRPAGLLPSSLNPPILASLRKDICDGLHR